MAMLNPNAAGIDIGSTEHWVAVPKDRDAERVRRFTAFTCDLHQIARWLKKCGITTIAMESTGIYWLNLFLLLEDYGFEVFLVNARHVKNVSGRKGYRSFIAADFCRTVSNRTTIPVNCALTLGTDKT